jgi:hypothetical protein
MYPCQDAGITNLFYILQLNRVDGFVDCKYIRVFLVITVSRDPVKDFRAHDMGVCSKGNLSCGFEKREVKGKKGRGSGVRVMCCVEYAIHDTRQIK